MFSVANGKTVHFSKGNLYAKKESAVWKWGFYDEQYEFLSTDMAVSGKTPESIEAAQREVADSETEIHLFTWGYSDVTSLLPNGETYINNDNIGDQLVYDKSSSAGGDDWGVAYCESNNITVGTWRSLTTAEWCYLFAYDPDEFDFDSESPRYNLLKCGVTVCDKTNCVVIAPDEWDLTANHLQDSYSSSDWAAAEAAGLVCLPSAGTRNGSGVYTVGIKGFYWSSSAYEDSFAFNIFFDSEDVTSLSVIGPNLGCSVRLVTEIK